MAKRPIGGDLRVRGLRIASHHEKSGGDTVLPPEPGEAADDVVDPVAGDQPAQLQDDLLVRVEPQRGTGTGLGDRPELARVEPAGDRRDLGGVGPVEPGRVLFVLGALGDQPVGLGDGPLLEREPFVGEGVRPPWWRRRTRPSAWKVTTKGVPTARLKSAATRADRKNLA